MAHGHITINRDGGLASTHLADTQRFGGRSPAGLRKSVIVGLKYFDQLLPLLKRLRDDECDRDRACNRELHFDQYAAMVLLYLFNPICSSMRAVQQARELPNLQTRLRCGRAAFGSLSEAATIFDPERLVQIIQELGGQLQPLVKDARLTDVEQTITLVDATLNAAMPRSIAASVMKRQSGAGMVKWRLHTHFEVERHLPLRIDVTPNGGGEHDAREVLERTIESDRLYIQDRGYAKLTLFNAIVAQRLSYVCRLRDNSVFVVTEERPLTEADRAARV